MVKNNLPLKLIAITLFVLGQSRYVVAQIDVEAIARFYFQMAKAAPASVDGFAKIVAGRMAPYNSHRSAGRRDSALVARTTDGTSTISWQTAPIPVTLNTDSVNLIWVAGFGNNQGQEKFQLRVNEEYFFEFLTSNEPYWRCNGSQGGHLCFTAIDTSRWGAYLGYMILTLPTRRLEKDLGVLLQVIGAASENEVWYRTYTYRDVLHHIRTHEMRLLYTDVKFWNLGDVTIKLVTDGNLAGKPVSLYSNERLLGDSILIKKGVIARAEFNIYREMQEKAGTSIQVRLDGRQVAGLNLNTLTERRLKAFLEEELLFEQYLFKPGKFPKVNWKRPAMVDNELGKFTLTTKFYDRNKLPVTSATAPGRYAAVVTGTTPAGFAVQRYVTFYCTSLDLAQCFKLHVCELTALGIQPQVWQSQQSEIEVKFSDELSHHLVHQPSAAILLAGLAEMHATANGIDSPEIRDRQWWIDFKNQQAPARKSAPVLKMPSHLSKSGKTLIEIGEADASFSPAAKQRIREICDRWARETAEPLVTLVAHEGVIVFHEAFGRRVSGEPLTCATPTWMASITKLLTGVLLMQFVDQGLVQLDAPIETYLPELAGKNTPKLTLRHLLTHTADLGWHGEWASDWNPALENYLALCLPLLKVGANFEYCRAGYAIAGKIMERLTNQAVPYLFAEYLLKPLGMNQTFVDNTYGSMQSTCGDLARLGQMLLNHGVYGEYRFFSETSYQKMLPQKLPQLDKAWGIGTAPLGGNGLSDQTFGHEAASGAIFRIDPVHHLIIVSARDRIGPNYEKYEHFVAQLINACTAPLKAKSYQRGSE